MDKLPCHNESKLLDEIGLPDENSEFIGYYIHANDTITPIYLEKK